MARMLDFNPNGIKGIERKARRLAGDWSPTAQGTPGRPGTFTSAQGRVLSANEEARQYLIDEAVRNLDQSVARNRRRRGPRGIETSSGSLRRAIENPANHGPVTKERITFIDKDAMTQAVPYWAAIEYGSRHMVGRRIPLAYIAGNNAQTAPAAARVRSLQRQGRPLDRATFRPGTAEEYRALNSPERRARSRDFVKIKNPIPTYAYAAKAIARFRANEDQKYRQILRKHLDGYTAQTGVRTNV